MQTVFSGKKKTKDGKLINLFTIIRAAFESKNHSHERENARRRKQMEKLSHD